MTVQLASSTSVSRPEVSVYWKPGCSSCLKAKEFVEEQGIPFESVNVFENTSAMDEILASGLRSIPAVRKGGEFVYAQSLDDVARLLGVTRNHKNLANSELFERWDQILTKTRIIVDKFTDEQLNERVIPIRDRSIKELVVHIFQIAEAFIQQVDEGLTEIRSVANYFDPAIVTKDDVLKFIEARHTKLRNWRANGGEQSIPVRLVTYYGDQPSAQVIERAAWHGTQHARQLDIIAAGRLGAEFEIPSELYIGLPLPKRLWE